jgi:biotin transport system substrate-specific component
MIIGNAVIYVPGMLWLGYMLAPAPVTDVMYKGMAVFMVGDVLKIIVAVVLFPTVWKMLNRR